MRKKDFMHICMWSVNMNLTSTCACECVCVCVCVCMCLCVRITHTHTNTHTPTHTNTSLKASVNEIVGCCFFIKSLREADKVFLTFHILVTNSLGMQSPQCNKPLKAKQHHHSGVAQLSDILRLIHLLQWHPWADTKHSQNRLNEHNTTKPSTLSTVSTTATANKFLIQNKLAKGLTLNIL